MNEPGITATIIDRSQAASTANLDTSIKTLCCVYAECGPTELTYINNVSTFLKVYTPNGKIEPNLHPTIIYAYTLLQNADLYIKRIGKQYILPAVTSLGEKIFVSEDKIVSGNMLSLSENPKAETNYWIETGTHVYYTGAKAGVPSGKTQVQIDAAANIESLFFGLRGKVSFYEQSETSVEIGDKIIKKSDNIAYVNESISAGKYKVITNNGDMKENDYLFFGGYDYYLATLNSFPPVNAVNPIPINDPDMSGTMDSAVFLMRVLQDNPVNYQANLTLDCGNAITGTLAGGAVTGNTIVYTANKKETTPALTIDNKMYYSGSVEPSLGGATGVKLSGKDEIDTNEFLILLIDEFAKSTPIVISGTFSLLIYSGLSIQTNPQTNSLNVTYDPNTITYEYEFPLQKDNNKLVKHQNLSVSVNNYMYFIGQAPQTDKVKVKLSSEALSVSEFIELVYQKALASFKCNMVNGNILFIEPVESVSSDIAVNISPFGASSSAMFAVAQKFTSSVDRLKFSYVHKEDKKFDITITYADDTETYSMSFNPDDVDGYGRSMYYSADRFSNGNYKVIQINENGNYLPSFDSGLFGSSVGAAPFYADDIIAGITEVFENNSEILWDIVVDSGVVNQSLAKFISSESQKTDTNRNYQYYVSLPPEDTRISDVQSYVNSLGLNNFKASYLAAGYKTIIDGNTYILPGSALALTSFYTLSAGTGTLFCSGFGQNFGAVTADNIIQKFNEADRKTLLDSQVNTLKKVDSSPWFINNNLTSQNIQSLLSNINNVRMICVINNYVNSVIDQFIGLVNDVGTRKKVTEVINNILQFNIFNQSQYGPERWSVICDETNNTTQVLNNQQLAIDIEVLFKAQIKYINVYSIILPLGS